MHSYLIVGRNQKERDNKIKDLAKKLGVNILEFSLRKISDTRSLNSFLKLTSSKPTAILINNVDDATSSALSAFLKNLEEPGERILYILTATSAENLLPTVVSRCQIIRLPATGKKVKQEFKLAADFLKKKPAERLTYIDRIKKKEEAIAFVEEFTLGTQRMLIKSRGSPPYFSSALKSAQTTLLKLKANGNVSLQLTNFVLDLVPPS